MKKKNFYKVLIPMVALMISGTQVLADVEESIVVYTSVPTYAKIIKSESSVEKANVNPSTGIHNGLSSIFNLETNGTDDDFYFIIKANIDVEGGRVNAYGSDGRILFAHTTTPPSSTAITNAMAGSGENKNVIAYGTNVTTTNNLTSTFNQNFENYGTCYVIKLNGSDSGTITHNVLGTPSANTYSAEEDSRGEYKAILSFTIIGR